MQQNDLNTTDNRDYNNKKKLNTDPVGVIQALRSWQILSPIGYSYDLFNDPVSIISRGKMQLIMHEDYGKDGVDRLYSFRHRQHNNIPLADLFFNQTAS